jgi:hypothetical protein
MPATDPTFSGWGFAADEDRIQASEDLLLAEMAKNHNDPPYHWTNDDEIDHLSLDDIDDLFHEMETGKKADPKRKPASSVERPTKRVKNNNASKAMTASTSAAAIPPTTNKAEPTTAMLEPATTEVSIHPIQRSRISNSTQPTPKSGKRRRKSRKSAAAPEATRTLRSSTTKTAESAAPAPIPAEAQVPAPGPSKLLPESWAVAMDEDKLLSMMKDQGHTWAEIIEMWTENSEMDYTQCSLKRRWGHLKNKLGRWAGFDVRISLPHSSLLSPFVCLFIRCCSFASHFLIFSRSVDC